MYVPRGTQRTSTNRSCGLIASLPLRIGSSSLSDPGCLLHVCNLQRTTGLPAGSLTAFYGGHEAVVRPDPIPNSAVKHCIADGSACIACARVGCRRFIFRGELASSVSSPFLLLRSVGEPVVGATALGGRFVRIVSRTLSAGGCWFVDIRWVGRAGCSLGMTAQGARFSCRSLVMVMMVGLA